MISDIYDPTSVRLNFFNLPRWVMYEMDEKNRIKPRKIRQLKKSGYLNKIKPSIPKNEEIFDIRVKIDAFNRIIAYIFFPAFIILFSFFALESENGFKNPPVHNFWSIVVFIIGIISYMVYIFFIKRGYAVKILIFTNKGLYLFNSSSSRGTVLFKEYAKDVKYVFFYRRGINLDANFPLKLTDNSLKFMYFLMYNYCTPKMQIKNLLASKNIADIQNEYQNIIQKTKFKISNERYNDICKRRKTLAARLFLFEIITLVIMVLILLYVQSQGDSLRWIFLIIIDSTVIFMGLMILIAIPQSGYKVYTSLKKISYLPDSTFDLSEGRIKATTFSGDMWVPFEDDMIIKKYDSAEKAITYDIIYDGIELGKLEEKRKSTIQLGPVVDKEYFYFVLLDHYLNWLYRRNLILNEEIIQEQYFRSDPFKLYLKEKIMIESEGYRDSDLSEVPVSYLGSDALRFRYPREIYNKYISYDEKIYHVHQQKSIPPSIVIKFLIEILLFGIFILCTFFLYYLQTIDSEFEYIYIFPLIAIFFLLFYFIKIIYDLKKIKSLEVVFTESKVVFRRKDWIYPLAYDDIKSVDILSINNRKQFYKYLQFNSQKRLDVMKLYDIGFDNPLLKVLNSKCKVR